MRQLHGLKALSKLHSARLTSKVLADLLMRDLQQCRCFIYGRLDETPVLLTELVLQTDSLSYEMFDQRIELTVVGEIIRNNCVPLTYRLQGAQFSITGRCSMIPKVCGVDLYLNSSYSGIVGDVVHQKFKIYIKEALGGLTK